MFIVSGSPKTNLRRWICNTHIYIRGGSPFAITVGNSWQADSVRPSLGYDCNIHTINVGIRSPLTDQ